MSHNRLQEQKRKISSRINGTYDRIVFLISSLELTYVRSQWIIIKCKISQAEAEELMIELFFFLIYSKNTIDFLIRPLVAEIVFPYIHECNDLEKGSQRR